MADTGAPWNLPYPLPTDLVRDGADAIKDLAEAAASGLDLAGNPGIGSNVVQTVKTNVFTTTSSTFTDVTGLTATITPTSATSKILVIADVVLVNTNTSGSVVSAFMRINGGNADNYVGDADGSRSRVTHGNTTFFDTSPSSYSVHGRTAVVLDSPGVATAVTYAVQVRVSGGTAAVNRTTVDSNSAIYARTPSSITLIEVAA